MNFVVVAHVGDMMDIVQKKNAKDVNQLLRILRMRYE
jgi:hypothetical protein